MAESKRKRVDTVREAYSQIFDPLWARSFLEGSDGTPYSNAAFNLTIAWKAVNSTHHFPVVMTDAIGNALDALANNTNPYSLQVLKAVRVKLIDAMSVNSSSSTKANDRLNYKQKARLAAEFDRILEACEGALKSPSPKLNVWQTLVPMREFQMCLWGSQRLCYAAIYYAYEDFLKECVGLRLAIPDYEKRRHDDFVNDIRTAFGQQIVNECYNDEYIRIARLVRDSLLHNGGRLTKQLNKSARELEKCKFLIEDEEVQITATQTKTLFEKLSAAATLVLEAAKA